MLSLMLDSRFKYLFLGYLAIFDIQVYPIESTPIFKKIMQMFISPQFHLFQKLLQIVRISKLQVYFGYPSYDKRLKTLIDIMFVKIVAFENRLIFFDTQVNYLKPHFIKQ